MDEHLDRWVNGLMDEQTNGQVEGWTNEWVGEWTHGYEERRGL